ncbi:MAG: hypothetical protein PF569_10340 [Candidatus Woesearchaeota archaeon]|jgi:hypothetical protein|nr:hypothetical protein [Candidatus Woesearchaeota archaeon]
MPIPKPEKDEKKNDFISRCMKKIGNEYPQKQALAICYNAWENKKESFDNKIKGFLNDNYTVEELIKHLLEE